MSDIGPGGLPLRQTWRSIGRRAAVAAGSLAALLSLLYRAPLTTAALRGFAAWAAVLAIVKLGLFALERAVELDSAEAEKDTRS